MQKIVARKIFLTFKEFFSVNREREKERERRRERREKDEFL